jgi:hypothetical protein
MTKTALRSAGQVRQGTTTGTALTGATYDIVGGQQLVPSV